MISRRPSSRTAMVTTSAVPCILLASRTLKRWLTPVLRFFAIREATRDSMILRQSRYVAYERRSIRASASAMASLILEYTALREGASLAPATLAATIGGAKLTRMR